MTQRALLDVWPLASQQAILNVAAMEGERGNAFKRAPLVAFVCNQGNSHNIPLALEDRRQEDMRAIAVKIMEQVGFLALMAQRAQGDPFNETTRMDDLEDTITEALCTVQPGVPRVSVSNTSRSQAHPTPSHSPPTSPRSAGPGHSPARVQRARSTETFRAPQSPTYTLTTSPRGVGGVGGAASTPHEKDGHEDHTTNPEVCESVAVFVCVRHLLRVYALWSGRARRITWGHAPWLFEQSPLSKKEIARRVTEHTAQHGQSSLQSDVVSAPISLSAPTSLFAHRTISPHDLQCACDGCEGFKGGAYVCGMCKDKD